VSRVPITLPARGCTKQPGSARPFVGGLGDFPRTHAAVMVRRWVADVLEPVAWKEMVGAAANGASEDPGI
jgi:hypothetical protein